jgi:tetratricopeptide (TPR) repeat protein
MDGMKFVPFLAAAAATLAILSGCGSGYESFDDSTTAAAKKEAAQMSIGDAVDILQRSYRYYAVSPTHQSVLEFTPTQFVVYDYNSDGSHARALVEPYEEFAPTRSGTQVASQMPDWVSTDNGWSSAPDFELSDGTGLIAVDGRTEAGVTRLAAALWRLEASTLADRETWAKVQAGEFAWIAATYRAASPKPQVPEAAYRSSVIAAAAIREKRFFDAANAYEDAVKAAPWWPQGQFNAALALGEVRYYNEAIDHMRKYLALVPNAPDARAAQNKIYAWQGAKAAFGPALPVAATVLPAGKPRLGVQVSGIPEAIAAALGQPNLKGALVDAVVPGSVAARFGVQPGDIVTAFGGKPIGGFRALVSDAGAEPAGQVVVLKIVRGKQNMNVSVQF